MQSRPHVLLSVLLSSSPPASLKALSLHQCSHILPASALHTALLVCSTLSLPCGVTQQLSHWPGPAFEGLSSTLFTRQMGAHHPSLGQQRVPRARHCQSCLHTWQCHPVPPSPPPRRKVQGCGILARVMLGGCQGTMVGCRGPSSSPQQHRNHPGSSPGATLALCSLAQGGCD